MKVLVADDSDVMRKLIINYLLELGVAEIDEAVDGAEALTKGKKGGHGLILLDWNMPKFTGYDVLIRLRGAGLATPIVMVTTEANRQSVLDAIRAGASSYLMKPFEKVAFQSRIRPLVVAAGT